MPPIAPSSLAAISSYLQARTPRPRMVQAAHEFEAQLMRELLHPLTNAATFDQDDDTESDSGGALADFATEALGQSLSTRGGLGIATSIVHSLSRNENASRSASNLGNASALSTSSAVAPFK